MLKIMTFTKVWLQQIKTINMSLCEKSNDSKQKVVGIVVHVSGVTLCLWTAAANGPIVHPPDDMSMAPWWKEIDRGKQNNLEKNLS
jgi:lauroyl/myristoyl acyltransferase